MIPAGALVELTFDGTRGIVVESWPPNHYDGRVYRVLWQDTGAATIVFGREIRTLKKTS